MLTDTTEEMPFVSIFQIGKHSLVSETNKSLTLVIRLRNTEEYENELKKRDQALKSTSRQRRWIRKTVIKNHISKVFVSRLESTPRHGGRQLIEWKYPQRESQEPEEEEEEKSYSRGQVQDKAILPLNQASIDLQIPSRMSSAIFMKKGRRKSSSSNNDDSRRMVKTEAAPIFDIS